MSPRVLVFLAFASIAFAQKKPPDPVGVKLLTKIHPERGYVDEAFAFDGPGGRVAYLNTDGAGFAVLDVWDLERGANAAHVDVSSSLSSATLLRFVEGGAKVILVGPAPTEGKKLAVLVDLLGKVVRKWGPVTDFALVDLADAEALVAFDQKSAGSGSAISVEAFRLDNGKQILKRTKLAVDAQGFVKAINLQIKYWRHGYTQAVGRKPGSYDKFKDQRMNDSEGTYDLLEDVLVRTNVPAELVPYTKLLALRTERNNQDSFLVVTEDLGGVDLVTVDDRRVGVKLDEPFFRYDPKSLAEEVGRDGKRYFSFTVDPVNPEAVARKVADPEFIDLYVLGAVAERAQRLARLPKSDRPFAWRIASGRWAVLRRHKGFSLGGPDLEVYELTAK